MASVIKAGNATDGVQVTSDNTGILELKTGTGAGTTAVTVNASQNVGIGTTSPNSAGVSRAVTINGSSDSILELNVNATRGAYFFSNAFNTVLSSVYTGVNLSFNTNDTTQARLTTSGLFQFNSGYGSVATAYGCRAWVNFNGTGTVAIRASGNVSSITDNGTGDYTVNFTTAMPDENYSVVATPDVAGSGWPAWYMTQVAGSCRIFVYQITGTLGARDTPAVRIAVFR